MRQGRLVDPVDHGQPDAHAFSAPDLIAPKGLNIDTKVYHRCRCMLVRVRVTSLQLDYSAVLPEITAAGPDHPTSHPG